MKDVVDAHVGELLAEVAEARNERTSFTPRHTFELRRLEKIAALEALQSKDARSGPFIRIALDRLQAFGNQIQDLYGRVPPDKKLDLDVAFSFVPLSKIQRIENLVERWITDAYEKAA